MFLPLFTIGIVLLVLVVYLPSQAAPAATFNVNTDADTNDGVCDVAHCTLREAVHAANGAPGADLITFSLPPSTTIALAGSQLPAINDTLTIEGGTAQNLIVSGADLSRIFWIGSSTAVTLTNLTITNGRAEDGGAIFNDGGTLNIIDSTISQSLADWFLGGTGYGGGILNTGTLNITRSTINGNTCIGYRGCTGGGIHNAGTLNISNSTISGNDSQGYPINGAGIGNGGILNVTNSTIEANEGRGISSNGILNFINTIIANSRTGSDCFSVSIGTNFNNLVEDGSCHPTLTGDPLLGPLQNNGGPTWTHALTAPSPVIDFGYEIACIIPPVNSQDQRGIIRPLDGDGEGTPICDIGAYEYDGPPPDRFFLPVIRRN
jgi:CSLREA domain-containing protein